MKTETKKVKFHRTKKIDRYFIVSKIKSFFLRLFIYSLLIIISFIILFPIISKLSASFMSIEDMYDRTVNFIPRHPNIDIYKTVISDTNYFKTALNSFLISMACALPQTIICACTGYALAKMKSRITNFIMILVILTVIVPPQVILVPLYLKFRFFDILGIAKLFTGSEINLMNSPWPLVILSITGTGLKNGIYIFLMRQFYKGVPEELEEAAAIDGCSVFKTYFKIIFPISIPMMVTIFILSFAWQWTDTFYSGIFFTSDAVLSNAVFVIKSAFTDAFGGGQFYKTAVLQTGVLMAIVPLVIMYIFLQRKIIAGIERSGIVG
ncbi:MAG: transporter permease [Herbinix sp.]|jgi:multiple sugar transport system permease protein|nr:transporter permease [Herbinix sp.]